MTVSDLLSRPGRQAGRQAGKARQAGRQAGQGRQSFRVSLVLIDVF